MQKNIYIFTKENVVVPIPSSPWTASGFVSWSCGATFENGIDHVCVMKLERTDKHLATRGRCRTASGTDVVASSFDCSENDLPTPSKSERKIESNARRSGGRKGTKLSFPNRWLIVGETKINEICNGRFWCSLMAIAGYCWHVFVSSPSLTVLS